MLKENDYNIALPIFAFSVILILLAVLLIVFINIQQKKKLIHAKEKNLMQSQFQQELLQTQIEIQEQTLKNISEEIHDNIGQALSLVKLNLNTFPKDINADLQIKVDDAELLVSKAIDDLRDLSQSMHGDKITAIGLQQAIAQELKFLQNTGRYKTLLQVGGNGYSLPPQKEMVLFRIVQEALHNAVKHAKAKNIAVQLLYGPATFILMVTDDGVGFDSAALQSSQTGIGLKSMQNRAALIGGNLLVHSNPGSGTSINIEMKIVSGE